MTEEQAYAAIGRMAVRYARELRGDDFCPRDDMDDCTIRILGMADLLDQMEEAGAFGAEATEQEPNRDYIWWRDAEEEMPAAGQIVIIWCCDPATDHCSIYCGYWCGSCWVNRLHDHDGEGIKKVLYWAPLNLPED